MDFSDPENLVAIGSIVEYRSEIFHAIVGLLILCLLEDADGVDNWQYR